MKNKYFNEREKYFSISFLIKRIIIKGVILAKRTH